MSAWAYAAGVALPVAVLLARLAMGFKIGDRPALIFFMVPIVVSAHLGGLGPGLLATAMAALLTNLYLVRLTGPLVASGLDSAQWIVMIVTGVLVSILTDALHRSEAAESRRAEAALREAREPLEARVQDRTAELARAYDLQRRSDENVRLLVEQAPISIAMFDREMRYLATSRRWIEEYGRGHRHLVGLSHYDIHPDLPEAWKAAHRRGLAGEVVGNDEDTWIHANGSQQWLRWAVHPWRDDQDEVGGVIISTEDITPRKRAEAAMRASEDRLRFALETVGVGAWDLDLVDHSANRTLGHDRIFGYETLLPQWTYEMFLEHVLPEDRAEVDRRFREAGAARGDWSFDCRIRRADGEVRWIWAAGRHREDERGQATRMAGIVQDITERKRTEEALRASRAKLEAALASMTDAVFISDTEGRFIDFNEAFATFHKFKNKQECARTFAEYPAILDVFFADGEPAPVEQWAVPRALRGETATSAEYTLRRKDTGESWVGSYAFAPIRDEHGTIVGSVVTGRDVTEHKRTEDEIRRLNAELERRVADRTAELQAKARELEAFTYSVSHDLKAPLRGIEGYSRLLLEDHADELDEEGRTFVHNVRKGTLQMGQLIDDLLTYSRVERRAIQIAALDPMRLLQELIDERADELRARGIEVSVDLPPGSVVSADREGLAMALRNLLDNALKFTRGAPQPAIAISGRGGAETFTIEVRDNGVGFDMKFHDRIFEVFQRLHRPEDFPGTGVGLAIVRKAMERMGGRAWAESGPGKGATFFLELPS